MDFYDIVYATTSYKTKQQNMKLVTEMFGKGKKVKDLTPQQKQTYRRAVMARYKDRQPDKNIDKNTEDGRPHVVKMFGAGSTVKNLTPEQRTAYMKVMGKRSYARSKARKAKLDAEINQILEETIDEMLKDGYAILPDTEAVLDEAMEEVFNVGLNPEAVPYIPYQEIMDLELD